MSLTSQASLSLDSLVEAELQDSVPVGRHMRVVYEEIVDMATGLVVGHEALTRVSTVDLPVISPEAWFASARLLGVSPVVEARAASLAIAALPPGAGMVAVNFSPDCLDHGAVLEALDQLAVLGRPVVLELSEHNHTPIRTFERSLDAIRERGLMVAVDDAGTGQSGPDFVRMVQPDIIKIDHTHISHVSRSEAQQSFIRRYADLAASSNAMLVTEGVSSPRIAAALRQMARRWDLELYGQGYWLSNLWQADGSSGAAGRTTV